MAKRDERQMRHESEPVHQYRTRLLREEVTMAVPMRQCWSLSPSVAYSSLLPWGNSTTQASLNHLSALHHLVIFHINPTLTESPFWTSLPFELLTFASSFLGCQRAPCRFPAFVTTFFGVTGRFSLLHSWSSSGQPAVHRCQWPFDLILEETFLCRSSKTQPFIADPTRPCLDTTRRDPGPTAYLLRPIPRRSHVTTGSSPAPRTST